MNLIEIETRRKIKLLAKNIVCKYYNLDIHDNSRTREYVLARSMYYKLLRDNTRMSYQNIGNLFSKNHATILHSIKQLNNHMKFDIVLRTEFNYINNTFLYLIDSDLLEKYNETSNEQKAEYLELLRDFCELKDRYNNLKHSHNESVEINNLLKTKYKKLFNEHKEREDYYYRNGYLVR